MDTLYPEQEQFQQWFNKAYRGLRDQEFRGSIIMSMGDVPTCKYRGPNGLKCAVGFLLDDENAALYDRKNITPSEAIFKIDGKTLSTVESNFLRKLQHAHDDAVGFLGEAEEGLMARNLKQLAKDFSLTVPQD
jgi:hypothetical protein